MFFDLGDRGRIRLAHSGLTPPVNAPLPLSLISLSRSVAIFADSFRAPYLFVLVIFRFSFSTSQCSVRGLRSVPWLAFRLTHPFTISDVVFRTHADAGLCSVFWLAFHLTHRFVFTT